MIKCDLHTHSYYSDGSDSPAQVIAEAKRLGLTVALTDHNTVAGVAEFMSEAERLGVTAIAGTELSTDYEGTELHLLGYFIAPEQYKRVEFFTKEAKILKEISNVEMIERLNAAGYNIDYASIKKRSHDENINRAHVAAELKDCGYVSSINEAFANILDEKYGFYAPPPRTKLTDAIEFLCEIGALAVIAHPLKDMDAESLKKMLPKAKAAGLVGIEVLHSSYSEEQKATARAIAEQFDLIQTGGSDYHGTNKPGIMLGVGRGDLEIPISMYHELLKAKNEREKKG